MIGNEIVDLAHAKQQSNWRRVGFLNKVFTPHEQQLIHTTSDPDRMVWLLWSMKESAYKRVARQTDKRIFAPNKIACQITASYSTSVEGRVFHEGVHQTISAVTDQYISTIAFSTNVSQPVNPVIIPFDSTTYQAQYAAIRSSIKQQLATRLSIPESTIHIHKNEMGVPVVTINDLLSLPISISHHGYYGAYVIAGDVAQAFARADKHD